MGQFPKIQSGIKMGLDRRPPPPPETNHIPAFKDHVRYAQSFSCFTLTVLNYQKKRKSWSKGSMA
jgi:hypothetical protein